METHAETEYEQSPDDEGDEGIETLNGDPHREAVDRVAGVGPDSDPSEELDPTTVDLATEWFMGDTPDVPATRTFELNVGKYDKEADEWEDFFIPWTVQAIGRDRVRAIRRAAQPRRQRRGADQNAVGTEDDLKANEMMAAEGTVHPSLEDAARSMGIANPGMVLRAKFKHKPGLIDMIASEVLSASGYDDGDVREVTAAKNS